jgi:hypothetical protein
MRVVQLTPPGSACSIVIGTGLTQMVPGSVKGLHLVVGDVGQVRNELLEWGVAVGKIISYPGASSTPTFGTLMATRGLCRKYCLPKKYDLISQVNS